MSEEYSEWKVDYSWDMMKEWREVKVGGIEGQGEYKWGRQELGEGHI